MSCTQEALDKLVGKTIDRVEVITNEEVRLYVGEKHLRIYHWQACCESVWLEDVNGDWDDLVGSPVLVAREVTSHDNPVIDKLAPLGEYDGFSNESYTWTFYTIATVKGTVDMRWYGTSNGYYSESVDMEWCV